MVKAYWRDTRTNGQTREKIEKSHGQSRKELCKKRERKGKERKPTPSSNTEANDVEQEDLGRIKNILKKERTTFTRRSFRLPHHFSARRFPFQRKPNGPRQAPPPQPPPPLRAFHHQPHLPHDSSKERNPKGKCDPVIIAPPSFPFALASAWSR